MSLIGKKSIQIKKGVSVSVAKDNMVSVKGAKGELKKQFDKDMQIAVTESQVVVTRPTDQKRHKSLHGLTRTIISNMIEGVSTGFEKKMELVGVGYKAVNQGQILDLALGYSHNIIFEVPKEVSIATQQEKGQNPMIILNSADNQLLGQVCAKLRSLRKPEPYKGKGVKFFGEVLRRKAGKSA